MRIATLLAGLAALAVAGTATASPATSPATTPASSRYADTCFGLGSSVHYQPVDENTILVRDGLRVFRVGVNQCHNLRSIQPVIVNVLRGTSRICTPLDLQLTILDGPYGFPEPCIAQSITRLTDAEIAAIPKRDRP